MFGLAVKYVRLFTLSYFSLQFLVKFRINVNLMFLPCPIFFEYFLAYMLGIIEAGGRIFWIPLIFKAALFKLALLYI
ncbi:hypothetical protein BTJ40_15330 [Microbulbifer sp. A4B17]|nr:hypothetical protein BTJ40_15330 [Microbulbifer sp. A4B17]